MLRLFLPTDHDLQRAAARQRRAAVLWVADTGLSVVAVAGQLAPLAPIRSGDCFPTCFPADDPALLAAERALTGETTAYRARRASGFWEVSVAPVWLGRRVIGIAGTAFLVDTGEVSIFECTRTVGDCHTGDLVTVHPTFGIRRRSPLTQRRFDDLLAAGVLRQVSPDDVAADARRVSVPAPAPPRPPLRLLRA